MYHLEVITKVMTVYENYNVIAFKSCIQIFTAYLTFYIYFDFFSLKISLLDHAASFNLNGLKNSSRKYFEKSLKSMQNF